MTESHEQAFDYDVALSFAGEDRAYVNEVANLLRTQDIRVFYDEFAMVEMWGTDLIVHLDDVYRKQSRFAVVFISRYYVSKPWPKHERKSAQARTLNELGPYLLPVRFDDSELPGLQPTVGYIDARHIAPTRLAEIIKQKVTSARGITVPKPKFVGVPYTPEEERMLLADRPPAWEYLLYAGVLVQRRQAIEEKWRDHEIGYAPRAGRHLSDSEAIAYLPQAMDHIIGISEGINRVLDGHAQEKAFGPIGTPGNPEQIIHLATRLIDVYEEFLDWAAALRGMRVSSKFIKVFDLAAHLADRPISDIREFIDEYVARVASIPAAVERGERLHIEMTLKLDIDNKAMAEYGRALTQAEKEINR